MRHWGFSNRNISHFNIAINKNKNEGVLNFSFIFLNIVFLSLSNLQPTRSYGYMNFYLNMLIWGIYIYIYIGYGRILNYYYYYYY